MLSEATVYFSLDHSKRDIHNVYIVIRAVAHEARGGWFKIRATNEPQQKIKNKTNSKILDGYTLRCKCMTNVRERPSLTGSPWHLARSNSDRDESSRMVDINTPNDI